MFNIFYGIIAWKDWCLFAAPCNSKRHLRAAAEIETLCSLFAGCISLTFINLLPSITANETPAQCLPLGHRQLQLPIIQRWSWIKDELFCHLSVATIHQAVMQGTYCGRSRAIFNYCQLLNYPRRRGSVEPHGSAPAIRHRFLFGPEPWASCAWGTWHQKQNLWSQWFFWGKFKEVQHVINSVLPSAWRVFAYGRAEP